MARGSLRKTGTQKDSLSAKLAEAEAELARLRSLIEDTQAQAKIAYWEYDTATRRGVWSDYAYNFFEGVEELVEPNVGTFYKYLHPDDLERFKDMYEMIETEGIPRGFDFRLVFGGETRHFRMTAVAERDASGKVARLIGTTQDITDLIEAGIALQESEERFARAVAGSNDGLWDWNIETNEDYFSERWADILGYRVEDLEQSVETFADLVHPDDRDRVWAEVQAHLKHDVPFSTELRMRHADGHYKWILSRGRAVRDAAGKPIKMAGSITDIDEHKAAEEDLRLLNQTLETKVEERTAEFRKSKEFTDRLLDLAQVIILVLDTDGKIVYFNRYMEELAGYSLKEKKGENWFESFIPEQEQGRLSPLLSSIQANLQVNGIINPIIVRSGAQRQIEWFNARLTDKNGTVTGTLSIGQDVTERLQIQAELVQSSKLATLGEMATGVAHELNQPLNVIKLAANNLLRRCAAGGPELGYLAEKLTRIDQQVTRASRIIDHMRIFGRKPGPEAGAVDLSAAVRDVLDLIGQQLKLSEISVDLDLSENCPALTGHRVQVEQIIINLLNNARDAILENGKIEGADRSIRISTRYDEGTGAVELRVRDSGGGIETDILDRIFEPFFTTKEIGKGTGLGLSIIYGIVNDMGGEISAHNLADGAEFVVSVPVSALAEAERQRA